MTRGSQSEKARRDGVHRSTVSRRVKAGKDDVSGISNSLAQQRRDEALRRKLNGEG